MSATRKDQHRAVTGKFEQVFCAGHFGSQGAVGMKAIGANGEDARVVLDFDAADAAVVARIERIGQAQSCGEKDKPFALLLGQRPQALVLRARKRAAVEARNQRGKFEIVTRPSPWRHQAAYHSIRRFMMGFVRAGQANVVQQRGCAQNQALLAVEAVAVQVAAGQAVVKLQRKTRDALRMREVRGDKSAEEFQARQTEELRFFVLDRKSTRLNSSH